MKRYIVQDPATPRDWRAVDVATDGTMFVRYMYKNPKVNVLTDAGTFDNSDLLEIWANEGYTITEM